MDALCRDEHTPAVPVTGETGGAGLRVDGGPPSRIDVPLAAGRQ